MRSEAAESSRETLRIKGGQSIEVGSRDSKSGGVAERREASKCKGGLEGEGFGGAEVCWELIVISLTFNPV